MLIKRQFPIADISIRNGQLTIDARAYSMAGKHENVAITIDPETKEISVKADRVKFGCTVFGTTYDPATVIESDTEYYKPWPWSEPKLRTKRDTWVEFKKRTPINYTANHYIIIE